MSVTHKFLNTADLTKSVTMYSDIFRCMVKLMEVEILRNPFDSSEGCYIVGEPETIDAVIAGLVSIITKIEKQVYRKKRFENLGHKSHARAAYRMKLINQAVELLDSKEVNEELVKLKKEHYKEHKNLKGIRLAYIQSCSLKNLTRYYGNK